MEHEPRAALILNRFTRNLSIMFATNAVTSILGLQPDEIKDKAFYEIIQENCLQNAIQCLESAKANESIAYLRFNFRDPRLEREDRLIEESEEEQEWERADSTSDSERGGARPVDTAMDVDNDNEMGGTTGTDHRFGDRDSSSPTGLPRSTSSSNRAISILRSSATGAGTPPRIPRRGSNGQTISTVELEAVVSCTSDGLVVVLRRARPPIPDSHLPLIPAFNFENGMCAAPWGQRPIEPYVPPELLYTFRPPLRPQYMPLRENVKAAGGPPIDQALRSIREAAVFAWPLTGINGRLADYGHGDPTAGAQPPDGLPIWDPSAGPTEYQGPENRAANRRFRDNNVGEAREPARLSFPGLDGAYTHDGRQNSPPKWAPARSTFGGPSSCAVERDQMPRPFTHGPPQRQAPQSLVHPPTHQAIESQLPVEPWIEAVRSRAYNSNNTAPSPRAPSPAESPQDGRYMW